ncbi:MAG TPA: beta-N-acetylglucosaminidase domain-containing protein [Methylomirabilota bacterium]|nr:beta-N-acetylglucosaminidase domain-containing protein [Methylomirabilota bacterium]
MHDLPKRQLFGVIEGFYGKPWSPAERDQALRWLTGCGLNTYVYAPKDDLSHRAFWRGDRGPKPPKEELKRLVKECERRGITFIYAISPGLDIRYDAVEDHDILASRCQMLLDLGATHFAILFDDIPDKVAPSVEERFDSLASAQAFTANELFKVLRESAFDVELAFCPTAYCGRMVQQKLGGEGYLSTIGEELDPEIDVFWTGPEIISESISSDHIDDVSRTLKRKPLIWDNLHANDYDGRRFFTGPFSGRELGLRHKVAGILLNPNNELPLNFPAMHTLGQFARAKDGWNASEAHRSALEEWLPTWSAHGVPLTAEDLAFFSDCYYLPHQNGPRAEAFLELARKLLVSGPAAWDEDYLTFREQAERILNICARLPELQNRVLFHALSRRVWDLREETDLLLKYINWRRDSHKKGGGFRSDFHLPHTFRGGFTAAIQRLLPQTSDGSFSANH